MSIFSFRGRHSPTTFEVKKVDCPIVPIYPLVLRERLKWNDLAAFALVFVAVAVSVFGDRMNAK